MNANLTEEIFEKPNIVPPHVLQQLAAIAESGQKRHSSQFTKVSVNVKYVSESSNEGKEFDSDIVFGDILMYWANKHELHLNNSLTPEITFEKYSNLNPEFKFSLKVNGLLFRMQVEEQKLYEIVEEYFNKFLFKKPLNLSSFELNWSSVSLEFINTPVLNKDSIRKS